MGKKERTQRGVTCTKKKEDGREERKEKLPHTLEPNT